MNDKGLNLNKGITKSSRIPSRRSAKEQDLNAELKPKTCFCKRTTHSKSANVTDRVDFNDVRIADCDICPDPLGRQNSQLKVKANSIVFGFNEECTSNTIKCWRCFLVKSMVVGTMQNIIYLKWECHRRRLVMRLLLKIAKCQGIHCVKNKAHEVHDEFWQCASVMFNQHPTSRGNSVFSDFYLSELTRGEDSRDIFPVEKALLLHNMSWFFLKDSHSENSRMRCCTLSHIQTRDVVPWLLRAFILSWELPLLLQKVSKLLSSICLISTVDGPISEPFSSESSLSTSHWASFFHQASLGTYLPCQYLACLKDKACFPNVSEMLPWENLPTLRSQDVYRMPSVGSISLTLRRCSYHKKNIATVLGFHLWTHQTLYYLLNPSGDLDSTQVEFEQWFRNQNWEGEAGKVPSAEELALALQNHDLFLYFGHGSGMQYIPGKEIQKLNKCPVTLLMGCGSGSLTYKGCYAPRGAPLSYLFAGSPVVIANLWEVTDKDVDRFGKALLKSWLQEEPLVVVENCTRCNQLAKEFGCLEIDDGNITIPKGRRKASKSKKSKHVNDKGWCKVCGPKRIASFMSEARDACKLPFLIGAAPVCYGVPTLVMKNA